MGASRLSARGFYGVIVGGVVSGAMAAGLAGRAYVASGDPRPDARRIWADVADDLVLPVAVMMGATFGGLAGVATAVALDRRR